MNLLDLAVKITCDDQASGEVDKIGDGIKNKLGAVATAATPALAAVGTATVVIGKTALDAYSNYEQLVGGIDTLFKGSSDKMQQYAANAYQTAGVSANRYMEISTSFAGALISSLGGNTDAAADMANTAITDMSDNANKMGTSLETVQDAYMSLSHGNYEMLDSLKLGYGGTKSELERLLSDAEKFSAAQGKVRDFSVDSYSDIVEAIHIVQDDMGITGTTAEEATTTIEGSVNKAKAAWDNWLAGLGNEDADMGVLTDQLVQSVATAGEKIIPRFGQIMSSLVQTVVQYAPQLGQVIMERLGQLLLQLANFIIQHVPDILNAAVQLFGMLAQGIAQTVPTIIATLASLLGQLIAQVISWAAQMLGQAISAGAQFLSGLAGQLSQVPGRVAEFLAGVISTVIGWVTQFASNATSAASQFGSKLRSGLEAIPGTLGNIGSNIVQGLVNGVTGAAGKLVDAVKGAVDDAIQGAKNLLGIKSPSRVFRKIGQYVMQGAALGVDDDADLLLKSTDNAMRGMISTAQDITYTPDVRSAAATASVIEWLDRNLGDVIASRTPYIGMRDFDRLARKAVANA